MKTFILSLVVAFSALAADPPKTEAPKPSAVHDTLTELDISRLETLQTRRDLLATQINIYEAQVKAEHPTLQIHIDPQRLIWVPDAAPVAPVQVQPAPPPAPAPKAK